MGRLCAVAAAASVLLGGAACGSAGTAQQAAGQPVEHAVVPDGYRQRTIREAGLSLALPRGWQVLAQRDAVYPGTIQILTRLNRGFGPYLVALGSPDSPLKLFAFDRSFWHGRPTTAIVVQATYGRPAAYGRWSHRMIRDLAAIANRAGPIDAVRIDLPAGPALRATDPTRDNRWFAATLNPAFPFATSFIGDYSNIAVFPNGSGVASYWTDLRNNATFGGRTGHGEDAYYAKTP